MLCFALQNCILHDKVWHEECIEKSIVWASGWVYARQQFESLQSMSCVDWQPDTSPACVLAVSGRVLLLCSGSDWARVLFVFSVSGHGPLLYPLIRFLPHASFPLVFMLTSVRVVFIAFSFPRHPVCAIASPPCRFAVSLFRLFCSHPRRAVSLRVTSSCSRCAVACLFAQGRSQFQLD